MWRDLRNGSQPSGKRAQGWHHEREPRVGAPIHKEPILTTLCDPTALSRLVTAERRRKFSSFT